MDKPRTQTVEGCSRSARNLSAEEVRKRNRDIAALKIKRMDPKYVERERVQEVKYRQTFHGKWMTTKKGAATHGRAWELTQDEYASLAFSRCHYCGKRPEYMGGIDRKDTNGDYTPGNCLPCCKTCNFAKHTNSYEYFESWLQRIVDFRNEKGVRSSIANFPLSALTIRALDSILQSW